MKKTGIELIAEERREMIEKHGWDLSNDISYKDEQLLKAALFCIDQKRFEWPFGWIIRFRMKILLKTRVDQLKVAGAFIAAEIDRLQALGDGTDKENRPTAQLIAAAPEMLKALIKARRSIPVEAVEAFNAVERAIKKAIG